jgi:predicted nucleotidyltransferase
VVLAAGRAWAERVAAEDSRVVAIGCFGSFARGDDAFGSDLDLIAIVRDAKPAPTATLWSTCGLPVPADLLLYDLAEWAALMAAGGRMADTLQRDVRWWVGEPPQVC